jgi:pilus assembly protein CpaC
MAGMTKNLLDTARPGAAMLARRLVGGLVLAAALLFAPSLVSVTSAHAGDYGVSAADGDGGRLVRIGLNKSIVIKLPGQARDVLVGNPDIVDAVVRTKNTAYLFARAVGQTNIFFFDANGQQILALDLEVAQDMTALQKLVRRTIPGSRIVVDTIGENVVLSGMAKNPAEAKLALDLAVRFTGDEKKVISSINVRGSEQVMLKVRVAEVQRNVLKQFGIDSTAIFSIGKFAFNLANINPFPTLPISPLGFYRGGFSSGGDAVDVFVRAMERDGLLRTLAEPTLTAVSGEAANFLAGGEFPVPVAQEDNTITIEFKKFGVGLGFTPLVMSEGRISLKISTEVSEISKDNSIVLEKITIPGLSVRRAETTVELPSGGSIAMAGLIKDSARADITGTPGLKDLPILGVLFRSRDFQQNQTELVVIVTPYIVNPVNEQQLAMPTDGLANATDTQGIFFGRLNRVYGAAGKKPDGVYHGNVGYIVE